MLIHKESKLITVTAGSGSENTHKFSGLLVEQIIVKAITPTNIFDLSITDEYDNEVYSQDAIEGGFEEHSLNLPIRGIHTISISSATVDENITVILCGEE